MFFLDLQTFRSGDEGWLVLDITAASDRWLLNHKKDLGLRLYVETEDGEVPGLSRELPWVSWEGVPAQAAILIHGALSLGHAWPFLRTQCVVVRSWTRGGPSQGCFPDVPNSN